MGTPTKKQIASFVIVMLIAVSVVVYAIADMVKLTYTDVWILCQPDSYVNIRTRPSTKSGIEGYLICGDKVQFDGQTQNGFMHCICTNESGEGWIYCGFVVTDEPTTDFQTHTITSNGRVACRKSISGDRRCWVVDGSEVYVYWMSDEWSVTSKGFIKTEFIGEVLNGKAN